MKVAKLFASAVMLTATLVAVNPQSASATGKTCKIEPVVPVTDIRNPGQNFTFNTDGTVTASFKVTGDATCKKYAVLAVWNAPNGTNGEPLSAQTLHAFDNNSGKSFGPGVHTLTADMPDCFWQLDLLEGTDPKGPDGTAYYGDLMKPLRHMLDTKHGGQECKPEEPETPENPKTPETPEKPQVKAAQTPKALPNTGAGAVAATFAGTSTLAAAAHAILRRLRIRR